MIVKQKSLRVFHITVEDKSSFLDYIKRNKILLMEFFLLVDGEIDKSIEQTLDDEGLCYKNISTYDLRFSSVKKERAVEVKKDEVFKSDIVDVKLKIFDRPIRSGEEISEELPVVVFGRINSGAKLFCSQSITIYGTIDGLVQCDGEYIVLQGLSSRGNLIFNGEIIDRELLKRDVLQRVVLKDKKVEIREV